VSKRISRLLETMSFAGAGAAFGTVAALVAELTGHPWWALLMLLTCAVGPSLLWTTWGFRRGTYANRSRLSGAAKVASVLLMIAATLAVEWAININPRDYVYVPLLPPVVFAAVLFGFGYGLLAVVVCTIIGDYLFALPVYDFAITEIEDGVGLSIFAVLGASMAWGLFHSFSPPPPD
jgi:integral membrane sensor domain MASE1